MIVHFSKPQSRESIVYAAFTSGNHVLSAQCVERQSFHPDSDPSGSGRRVARPLAFCAKAGVVHRDFRNAPALSLQNRERQGQGTLASETTRKGWASPLRHIERTLQLRIERMQVDPTAAERPQRFVQNTLASRTLIALPGEVFV